MSGEPAVYVASPAQTVLVDPLCGFSGAVSNALEAFAPDDIAHMKHAAAILKEADRMEGGFHKVEQTFATAAFANRAAAGRIGANTPLFRLAMRLLL